MQVLKFSIKDCDVIAMMQMTQLDAQVQEFRRSVEKRNHKLETELEITQKQLKERNSQVSFINLFRVLIPLRFVFLANGNKYR